MNKLPISNVKKNFSRVITAVEHGVRIAVVRHGRPAAALVSIEDYNLIKRLRGAAKKHRTSNS